MLERKEFAGIKPGVRGVRGRVVEFSAASRARLLYRLMDYGMFEGAPRCWFVTLTQGIDHKDEVLLRAEEAWRKWLSRSCKTIGAMWIRERQKRGALHSHYLVVADEDVNWSRADSRFIELCGIQGSEAVARYRYGVDVKEVTTQLGVALYMAKISGELTKRRQRQQMDGRRCWGVWRAAQLEKYRVPVRVAPVDDGNRRNVDEVIWAFKDVVGDFRAMIGSEWVDLMERGLRCEDLFA